MHHVRQEIPNIEKKFIVNNSYNLTSIDVMMSNLVLRKEVGIQNSGIQSSQLAKKKAIFCQTTKQMK